MVVFREPSYKIPRVLEDGVFQHFARLIQRRHTLVRTDNYIEAMYIDKQGGIRFSAPLGLPLATVSHHPMYPQGSGE